jgi:hypothetical protein
MSGLAQQLQYGRPMSNLSEGCIKGMKESMLLSNVTECASTTLTMGRNQNFDTARYKEETDRYCANVDRCAEAAKTVLKNACPENEQSKEMLDRQLKWGIAMRSQLRCVKDASNNYCHPSQKEAFCSQDCVTKKVQVIKGLKDLPEDKREKFLKAFESSPMCSNSSGSSNSSYSGQTTTSSSQFPTSNSSADIKNGGSVTQFSAPLLASVSLLILSKTLL